MVHCSFDFEYFNHAGADPEFQEREGGGGSRCIKGVPLADFT